MRDGLKWSDGTDLNAKDFEYSFKRMVDPNTAAPYAETCLGMIDGFEEAAGFPDADGNPTAEPNPDALNVKASDDGKTLTIVSGLSLLLLRQDGRIRIHEPCAAGYR